MNGHTLCKVERLEREYRTLHIFFYTLATEHTQEGTSWNEGLSFLRWMVNKSHRILVKLRLLAGMPMHSGEPSVSAYYITMAFNLVNTYE